MALGGPYFSQFLLYTLFAHASRHASPEDPRFHSIERGEKFLAKAKLLLQAEMEQSRPKIPTIQALLILGGRQCAVGKNSEGWLYTGMVVTHCLSRYQKTMTKMVAGKSNDERHRSTS